MAKHQMQSRPLNGGHLDSNFSVFYPSAVLVLNLSISPPSTPSKYVSANR